MTGRRVLWLALLRGCCYALAGAAVLVAMSMAVVLAYFDLRRAMLSVYCVLLATNVVFTLVTLDLGFAYYGYGYFFSALVSFVVVAVMVGYYVSQLPYLTFVRNNSSVL